MMNTAVKKAVISLNLEKQRILKKYVGIHSLRAGGAMVMNLNGIDKNTIKNMGRWSTDTFLIYIHEKIVAFYTRFYKQMLNTHCIPEHYFLVNKRTQDPVTSNLNLKCTQCKLENLNSPLLQPLDL